jgi:D-alanine--poly(phosphoribitol) ligase subunit 2
MDIVIQCVEEYFESQDISEKVDRNTTLFGNNSSLDSIGLVSVVVDIESRFSDEDFDISLTSENAMSRRNSPFRTISTLAEFIKEQIEGNDE